MLRPYVLGWFLVLCVLVPRWAHGSVPVITASQVQGITDSTRAKVLAHLAREELADERDLRVTELGLHVVVRMKDRIYDAFTGAGGLSWQEYMSRLGAMPPIMDDVVSAP
ncbi:hypothetical protein POL68_39640 [Stigmatella sp. ncwal1]|uniref:Uncharacterized protein n=1 Tax=Stigmatella ashevillensis TaxID=2995309 RepID=A0ABT5DLT3_9BACT|nr:hypothetical protein [Stigmatella ashevillena]MDC0714629.1 hypothetical protein [Stigmatella ashevillena]